MSASRPLPPRPSLAFERKAAKALLRRLRAGDPDARARAEAQDRALADVPPDRFRLADAQRVAAREYGFASWPQLVRYFEAAACPPYVPRQLHHGRPALDGHVRGLLADHRAGRSAAARAFAAYVPRFYGERPDAVLAAAVTEDDARLVVARWYAAPSWAALLERVAADESARPGAWEGDPFRRAVDAVIAGDVAALEAAVADHPALLDPTPQEQAQGRTLIGIAVGQEGVRGADALAPVMAWLAARGMDWQTELDRRLCGWHLGMHPDEVRTLLAQGANPNWVAPTGIPVLEHALLRYWNAESVDVLVAAGARPRRALWAAAGLGDVPGVLGWFDRRGRVLAAAHRRRPAFDAAGFPGPVPALPDADDEELLVEALFVAVLNGRGATIAALAARGAPVDSLLYGMPLAALAAGNGWAASVEALVRAGADLDRRGAGGEASARELARELFVGAPNDPTRRRVADAVGLDAAAVLAAHDAQAAPPTPSDELTLALALAADDAARLGAAEVGPEHLLVGLVRANGPGRQMIAELPRLDPARLRAALGDRLRPVEDRAAGGPPPPLGAGVRAAVDAATALATERRRDAVEANHLLHALLAAPGAAADLLAEAGADVPAAAEMLGQSG